MLDVPSSMQLSRNKRLRLFLTGDYEFLCRMYGLTGANGTYAHMKTLTVKHKPCYPLGRHCCLWCHITSQELILDPSVVQVIPSTLDMLTKDHSDFLAAGGT